MTDVNEPSPSYKKLQAPKPLRGIHAMEQNLMIVPPKEKQVSTKSSFDPMTCTSGERSNVPERPFAYEALDQSTLLAPKARLLDPLSFNSRHRDTLEREHRAFYRTKGAMETYLEDAHSYRDFLVWQASHPRGNTRGNNPSNFKPANDFYDVGHKTTDTHRLSTSRLMVNRHLTSRNSSGTSGVSRKHREPPLMVKDVDPPVTRVKHSPRTAREVAASETLSDISKFERTHHHLCEIENMTKEELIELIQREGMEIPGEEEYEQETGKIIKKRLKKRKYLEYVRQRLFQLDDKPVVQKGHRLGKQFCIVSIYRSLRGAVRVIAYDTERSMEYHLYLTAARLEDLDIPRVPLPVALEEDPYAFKDLSKTEEELESERQEKINKLEEQNHADWQEWGTLMIDRLQLTPQGDLYVGPARILANGLSRNFCLTGRDQKTREEARKCPPSRTHITLWFNM